MLGSFTILDFDDHHGEPDTVYVEGMTGGLYLDKPEEVKPFRFQYERLQEQSLNEDRTRDLMSSCAKEYARER